MKKLVTFLLILVLLLTGIFLVAQGWIVKGIFASAVRGLTGFDTQVQGLRLDLTKGIFHLEGLILYNPYNFEERVFADAPKIYLEMNLPALLKKEKIHLRELRLDIRQLNIEKNPQGISNVSLLNPVKKPVPRRLLPPPSPSAPKKGVPFQLDHLELTLRRVSYNDRSGFIPKKLSVDMHVNQQVFEGIQDPKFIINIILMKVISSTPFGNLGINTAELQNQLESTVKTARDLGERTFDQVGGVAKEEITNLWGKFRSKLNADQTRST